jgi:hypothetical protein
VLLPGLQEVVAGARRSGYITTLAGRRRYFGDINSSNFTARGKAERAAVNSVPQGSAADLVKCVMVDLTQQLAACGLGDHVRLLLQVGGGGGVEGVGVWGGVLWCYRVCVCCVAWRSTSQRHTWQCS